MKLSLDRDKLIYILINPEAVLIFNPDIIFRGTISARI